MGKTYDINTIDVTPTMLLSLGSQCTCIKQVAAVRVVGGELVTYEFIETQGKDTLRV